MRMPSVPRFVILASSIASTLMLGVGPSSAVAASGTWSTLGGGSWPVTTNWTGGTVADGADFTADFSTLNLSANATVSLDGARTIGNLTFGDATTASHNWILDAGTGDPLTLDVTTGSSTITVNNQTATVNVNLAGDDSVTKAGAGTLVLNGANTGLIGAFIIGAGDVRLNTAANALSSAASVTVNGTGRLFFANPAATTYNVKSLTTQRDVVIDNASTLQIDGGTLNFGTSGFWIQSTGVGSGVTTAALGKLTSGTGTLTVTSALADYNTTADQAIRVQIVDGASSLQLVKAGGGNLRIDRVNTYTGGTVVNGGRLELQGVGTLGSGVATVNSGGQISFAGVSGIFANNFVLSGNGSTETTGQLGALRFAANRTLLTGSVTLAANSRIGADAAGIIDGVIADGGNNFGIEKTRGGTLVLNGMNTYGGPTSINEGTVTVSSVGNAGFAGNLGTNGTINLGFAGTNGVLNYIGVGETTDRVLNWAGAGGGGNVNANGLGLLRFTNNTMTTGSGAKGLSFSGSGSGQLDGTITNNGGLMNLNKNGIGTWTLNGNLTLGGGNINVNSGTLNVGGMNTTSGAGAYVVAGSGRLVLAGSGTNNAPITVNGGGIVGGAGSTTGLLTTAANAAIQLNPANPMSALTTNGVTFNGATTISFDGTPVDGSYTVLNYGSGAVTGIANLVPARGGIVDNGSGQIVATVQTAARTWGGTTGAWDNGTSNTWTGGDQKFFAGDTVTFNEPAAANTVTLGGPLAPASVTVNNSTNAYTLSGTGVIVGTASLTKAGAGTLTISNANNYFGGTTVNGGTLMVGNATALGTGPVAISGGATLGINGAFNVPNSIAVTGGSIVNSSSAGNASATIVNLSGIISGNGNWTLAANGDTSDTGGGVGGDTLLSGGNTFTGNLTITSGVVDLASSFGDAANAITLNGGGLVDRNNSVIFTRNIQVGANGGVLRSFGSATTTFTGAIANAPGVAAATLKHTDGGTQRLAGDGSGFTGTFTNARGNLEITANNANWQNTDFILDGAGGTMTVNGGGTASVKSITMTKDVIANNGTRLNVSAVNWSTNSWIKTNTAATPGTVTSSTGTLTVNVTAGTDHQIQLQIQDFNGSTPVSFVKNGPNDVNLTVSNIYTGGTTVNQGVLNLTGGGGANGTIRGTATVNTGGTLRLSTGDATGYDANTRLSVINLNGGTLNVNSTANQTLGNAVINMTGGTITGVANSNLDFFQGSSGLNSLASVNTSTISGVGLSMLRQGNTTVSVEDGAAPIDLQVNSVIRTSPSGDPVGAVLKKTGAGTLVLTANNTFARELEIAAGTVLVNNVASLVTDSGTGAGPVDVQGGAVIGGTGTIAPGGGGGITIAGVVAPGTSIGNLTFNLSSTTGIVSLTGGSFQFELGTGGVDINSAGTGDLLTIGGASAGDVAFSNNLIDFGGTGTAGWFKLFDTSFDATTWTGLSVGGGNVITSGLSMTNLPVGFTGDLVLGDGVNGSAGDIYANVVPEPGAAVSLLGGLGVVLGVRRRRSS